MRESWKYGLAILLGLAVLAASTRAEMKPKPTKPPTPTITFSLFDLKGATHNLGQNDKRRVRAFIFLSTECPISNGYVKTLSELRKKYATTDKRVDFFGVVSDPTVTRASAAKHFTEYKAKFPVLFDASTQLVEALKPSHVPNAFVLNANGELVYQGAIDNAWEDIGRRRPKAEKNYLADAISATLTGKPVTIARTTPVGCLIETLPSENTKADVTYNRDIAPIIQARCQNCHRDGQVAPFPLTNYAQTAKRARQIVRVTQARIMPP